MQLNIKAAFGKLFKAVSNMLHGHLPSNWLPATEGIINVLNQAKKLGENPGIVKFAELFGIHFTTEQVTEAEGYLAKALPDLEIAEGFERACDGKEGTALADAAISYIIDNISKKQAKFQGKHWMDVAQSILSQMLKITRSQAMALLQAKIAETQAEAAAGE